MPLPSSPLPVPHPAPFPPDTHVPFDLDNVSRRAPVSPEENAPWYARVLFHWVTPLVARGARSPLQDVDLLHLNSSEDTYRWARAFALERPRHAHRAKPVFSTFWALFKPTYAIVFGLAAVNLTCALLVPSFIREVLTFLQEPARPLAWGVRASIALCLFALAANLSIHHLFHIALKLGMRMRAALVVNIYEKSLRLTPEARRGSSVGETVNLMSNDAANIYNVASMVHQLVTMPLQFLIAGWLLWRLLGVSALAGLAVMLLLIPASGALAKRVVGARRRLVGKADDRVGLVSEILAGIRVIKYHAWEESFLAKVREIRESERSELSRIALLATISSVVFLATPIFVGVVTFSVHVLRGEALDAPSVFSALAIFGILRPVMAQMPFVFSSFVNALVSEKRIEDYLRLPELPPRADDATLARGEVRFEDVTATWDLADTEAGDALRSLTLSVPPGALVALVGPVGAGKSSVLEAVVGRLRAREGNVRANGRLAYVPQQAWILNATLRENVLFGKPYERARYLATLEVCGLATDVGRLPAGDATEIGERGVNLSGGQKQRVCLARALYADADVVLLDDTLSALDNRVGAEVFEKCLRGAMAGRTRILVTHRLEYAKAADIVVRLEEGRVAEWGPPGELLACGGAFADDLAAYARDHDHGPTPESAQAAAKSHDEGNSHSSQPHAPCSSPVHDTPAPSLDAIVRDDDPTAIERARGRLVLDEERYTGSVRGDILTGYMRLLSPLGLVWLLLASFALREILATGSDAWLARGSSEGSALSPVYFIGFFAALGVGASAATFLRSYLTWKGGVRAALSLHEGLLRGVLRAPVSFFDSTPQGRILNRFGKDTEAIDQHLPNTFLDAIGCLFVILTTLIVMVGTTPLNALAVIPLSLFYFRAQGLFRKNNREVKRIESITRSPLYAHFSETLGGVSVIRAFGVEERFVSESVRRFQGNQRSFYTMISLNRWLGTRLELIGALVAGSAALFAVFSRGSVNPSLAGVSVTYAFLVTGALNWAVRMFSEIESSLNSVERVRHYTDLPAEAWDGTDPGPRWPARGEITFRDLTVRYRDDLPPVLRDFTLHVEPGETIGIVGRTGAGKSTVFSALFRFVEASSGTILVDGVDISTLPLSTLRRAIGVIPQDPVLFAGTLRRNLDPFGEHPDARLLEALNTAGLSHRAEEGLDAPVEEGGANLSVGERQLLCLARALLRDVRILLMDEATASVDFETDARIHATIKERFASCTVLVIAHRIGTVRSADRVVVLDKGAAAEVGAPSLLLAKPGGHFRALAKESST